MGGAPARPRRRGVAADALNRSARIGRSRWTEYAGRPIAGQRTAGHAKQSLADGYS